VVVARAGAAEYVAERGSEALGARLGELLERLAGGAPGGGDPPRAGTAG
jgi:hypothetical protein